MPAPPVDATPQATAAPSSLSPATASALAHVAPAVTDSTTTTTHTAKTSTTCIANGTTTTTKVAGIPAANGANSNDAQPDVEMSDANVAGDDSSDGDNKSDSSDFEMIEPAAAAASTPPIDPTFYEQLTAGQQVDVYCVLTKQWLPAKIDFVADDRAFRVHYIGWNKTSDEVIDSENHARIAPRARHATTLWTEHDARLERRKRPRDPLDSDAAAAKRIAAAALVEQVDPAAKPLFVAAGATRSGRTITKRVVTTLAPPRRSASAATSSADNKSKAKSDVKAPTAAAAAEPDVLEDDLCASCGQIEDDELTDMILCDGGCLSSYHFSCLGLEAAPTNDPWLCEQCRTREQMCFLCGRFGTMGEKGGVFRCSAAACGKFYHQRCISSSKLARRFGRAARLESASTGTNAGNDTNTGNSTGSTTGRNATLTDSDATTTASDSSDSAIEFDAAFRCPRHVCAVCEDLKKGSDLMCCIRCPEAYHPQCVPPSARYNSVALLCARHPLDKLPRIPAFYYNDPLVDAITVDSTLRLPPLFLPKKEPDASDANDVHHFRLLLNVVDAVRQKAPPYKKLARSIYTFKKPPSAESLDDAPMCVCTTTCGDDCINRLSFTECYGPAPTPGMTKFTKLTRESNCRLGEDCGNRALHQKLYPRFEKFYTQDKGWGLRVLEPVKAGTLVIEYVGEVVNEVEKERRLLDHATHTPDDKNMYVMELSKGVYIDARFKGSVSRYINHACDPNCHLLKWRVKGENRIAITALKDIAAGDELSYDYQFHTQQALEWKCHCKAPTCRGTMAPEKLTVDTDTDSTKKLTKKEQLERMKRQRKQEKIQQEREGKSSARRLSLTSQLCGFGDTGGKSLVRIGPAARELAWAAQSRVFLKRNALRGFDFLHRKELKDRKFGASSTPGSSMAATKLKLEHGAASTMSTTSKDDASERSLSNESNGADAAAVKVEAAEEVVAEAET